MCEIERKAMNEMDGRREKSRAVNERGLSMKQGRMIVHDISE